MAPKPPPSTRKTNNKPSYTEGTRGGTETTESASNAFLSDLCEILSCPLCNPTAPARSADSGEDLFLDPSRVYGSYLEMVAAEAKKPMGQRLEAGFNVVCDKPVTFDLKEAIALRKIVAKSKKVFALTHNYTGNAMVKQARELVRTGKLGTVRKVVVEYPQGWLSTALEKTNQKQAAWRTDPKRSGEAGCIGDIGTHAENLARYITGLEIESLCADLTTFVQPERLSWRR